MSDKEALRRAAIVAAYIHPAAPEPRHDTTNAERPRTASGILAVLVGHNFEVEEKSATVYDTPRWRTLNPDDANLSYIADPIVVYHLGALRTSRLKPGEVKAVDVLYLGGRPFRSRIGYAKAGGRGEWQKMPVLSVAKILREELNK